MQEFSFYLRIITNKFTFFHRLFTEPTGKEGIFMRYSYGFKRNAVELYREGLWPGTPKGVKEYNFRKMVRSWVRLEEAK